jgi:hypothetical protein
MLTVAHRELRQGYAKKQPEPTVTLRLVTENHPDILEHSQDDAAVDAG